MVNRCFIGTSGWVYPHWRGVFYPCEIPERKWLSFYTRYFDTVEINASFYHLPRVTTFSRWREETPPDFLFAVKGSRYITHVKKLLDPEEPLQRFYAAVLGLQEKCGPLLFQFPPRISFHRDRLEAFLTKLNPRFRYVFEFRHPSFFEEEVYELLQRYGVALCFADTPFFPYEEVLTAPLVYVRLHGSGSLYTHCYSEEELRHWAEKVKGWQSEYAVFLYFDNDYEGFAVRNALRLKELLA